MVVNSFVKVSLFRTTRSSMTSRADDMLRSLIRRAPDEVALCCVGQGYCNRPRDGNCGSQCEDCQHCDEECHFACGEYLDVLAKYFNTEPGFYCNRCIFVLPRYLYPKMPKNGVPRNVPKERAKGLGAAGHAFEDYIDRKMKMRATKKAKKEMMSLKK